MLIDVSRFDLDSDDEDTLQKLVGPPGHWRQRRDLQLNLLSRLGISRDQSFLDLGCGALRLGLPLIAYLEVGRYTGIDIDPDCVDAARTLIERFDLQSQALTVRHSTSFGVDELAGQPGFDRIWAFQVFIHLTESLSRDGIAAVSRLLAPDGVAWITLRIDDSASGFRETGTWREKFAVSSAPLSYYTQLCAEHGLRLERLGSIDASGTDGRIMPKSLWSRIRDRKKVDLALVALTRA